MRVLRAAVLLGAGLGGLFVQPVLRSQAGSLRLELPQMIEGIAVSQTHIVFSHNGDLWRIGRGGGEGERLTDGPVDDSFPVFSPDGKWIAFARSAGDVDVYVMPSAGGAPRRLTYFPKFDFPVGWSADSAQILFGSLRDGDGVTRLYSIPAEGVFETPLPLPTGVQGSYSPDGRRLAYLPKSMPPNSWGTWRFYRGGLTSPLWIVRLDDLGIERVTGDDSNARFPMWVGDRVYFLSDRSGIFNLHAYDTSTKRAKALTSFTSTGIDSAAATSDAIAFVRHGEIHLYDLKTGATRQIGASIAVDAPERAPRTVSASRFLESVDFAAADRIVFGVRGEVLTFNPVTGEGQALTTTSGIAERYPALSPDGQRLAYFSDESGEYELHLRAVGASSEVRKIRIEERPSFYREPTWSPDSRKLAFSDIRLALWIADADTGRARRVDESSYIAQGEYRPDWSHDSRYLAYAKAGPSGMRAAFVYDTLEQRKRQITDGSTHVESPVFDAAGRYLYFISSNNARLAAASDTGWALLSTELARPLITRTLHLAVLSAKDPSPFLRGTNRPRAEAGSIPTSSPVQIDFENLDRRIVQIPGGPRDYSGLRAGTAGEIYLRVNERPTTPAALAAQATPLYRLDLAAPTRLERLADDADSWSVSHDRRRLFYVTGQNRFLTAGVPGPGDDLRLDLRRLEIRVDPGSEWVQMYREAWRQMRDTFYDPNHHGQNLADLERLYEVFLPGITGRAYLNRLFSRMLGHVSVSHLGVGGGDMPAPAAPARPVGDIGADFDIDQGRYRFKKIVRSPHFSAATGLLNAPLDQPGIDIREGDYLVAVDGQPATLTVNAYALFEGKVDQPVQLTVSSEAGGTPVRAYTVVPQAGTGQLRHQDRAQAYKRRVDQLSNGKIAYVYIGGYNPRGVEDFERAFLGMNDRQALIIDQRFNGGGTTADSLIEWLNRSTIYRYAYRYGDGFPTPPATFAGPKVLITNEQNFSAAETFALMFKLTKTGTIVGTRTGGGGIGTALFQPALVDGGRIGIPNRAAYNPSGSWDIENSGVTPDVQVEILPRDWREGRDPQLEAAVKAALDALRTAKPVTNRRPAYPVHR